MQSTPSTSAIVLATRSPATYGEDLSDWLAYGGSPRATIALDRCARAHAWLAEQDYVGPENIQAVAPDVLRHRMYFEDYRDEANAMALYAKLPVNASACTTCAAPCLGSCPVGIDIPTRTRGAHDLLTMNG